MGRPALPPERIKTPLAVRLLPEDHKRLELLVEADLAELKANGLETRTGNAEVIERLIKEAFRARGLTLPGEAPAPATPPRAPPRFRPPPAPPAPPNDVVLVLRHVRELAALDPFEMASIPALVRAVGLPTPRTWAALDALRLAGRVELRKEDSPQLLSPADRALCPPGPRGSILGRAVLLT